MASSQTTAQIVSASSFKRTTPSGKLRRGTSQGSMRKNAVSSARKETAATVTVATPTKQGSRSRVEGGASTWALKRIARLRRIDVQAAEAFVLSHDTMLGKKPAVETLKQMKANTDLKSAAMAVVALRRASDAALPTSMEYDRIRLQEVVQANRRASDQGPCSDEAKHVRAQSFWDKATAAAVLEVKATDTYKKKNVVQRMRTYVSDMHFQALNMLAGST